ncbi:hypothetical protein [Dehalococcoides mccartyi]|jgi:hypothetical protein
MIKIGITGHQKLDNTTAWNWVEAITCQELDMINQPVIAVSSLAIGADQLFASLVMDRGGQLYAVIPFDGYERTFSPLDVKKYHRLLSEATSVEVLRTKGTDEDAYLAAGKRIVELADLMFAVWNGQPAKGKGGTADIVSYALEKNIPLVHINPQNRTVTQK